MDDINKNKSKLCLNDIPYDVEGNIKAENILRELRKNFENNVRKNKINKKEINFIKKNKE